MSWRNFVVFMFVVAAVIVARYCAPPPIGVETLPLCGYEQVRGIDDDQDEDAPYVEQGTFFVADGRGPQTVIALTELGVLGGESASVSELSNPADVADLLNEFYCSPYDRTLSGADLAAIVETDIWVAFDQAVDVVILPDGVAVDEAIDALGGPENDFGAVPEQLFSTLNHYGAFPGPGSKPVAQPEPAVTKPSTGGGPRIAVIDTGFYDTVGVIHGAGMPTRRRNTELGISAGAPNYLWRAAALLWNTKKLENVDRFHPGPGDCEVSHGEFVASVIRQVEPTAEIYGFNAFHRRPRGEKDRANCWETSEFAVMVALGRAELAAEDGGFTFDAVNMSFGSILHNSALVSIPPVGLASGFATKPTFAEVFVAAARNTWHPDPIYPADFETVLGIAAEDKDDFSVFWDENGKPIYRSRILPPAEFVLGCHLVGNATADPTERFMWSGSSFAAPLYAGSGSNAPDHSTLPGALTAEGQMPTDELDHCGPLYRDSLGF